MCGRVLSPTNTDEASSFSSVVCSSFPRFLWLRVGVESSFHGFWSKVVWFDWFCLVLSADSSYHLPTLPCKWNMLMADCGFAGRTLTPFAEVFSTSKNTSRARAPTGALNAKNKTKNTLSETSAPGAALIGPGSVRRTKNSGAMVTTQLLRSIPAKCLARKTIAATLKYQPRECDGEKR